MITFGPVPSRRLGRSLGINNIPPKGCTYSCVYCQLGRTKKMEVDLRAFYDPEEMRKNIAEKIKLADSSGEPIDFLTYVSDGEPSLDIHLGQEIELIQPFDVPIAVITNSSLIWRDSVKESLNKADWVSLKIDSVEEDIWRKIDRPHRSLELQKILDGIIEFSRYFKCKLVTEPMLLHELNDSKDQNRK